MWLRANVHCERSGGLRGGLLCSPDNTANNVAHGAAAVASEDLNRDHLRSLGNTVLARSDGASAVSAVTVAILVNVVGGDGLAPRRTALELDVLGVDTGVDDVDVDALTAVGVVDVLGEGPKGQLPAVADARKTLTEQRQHATSRTHMMAQGTPG